MKAKNKRLGWLAAALTTLVIIYSPLAYYFSTTYTSEIPDREDVAPIYSISPTNRPGVVVARLWLPEKATAATIHGGGTTREATAVYNDPARTFVSAGKRWKYVEFSGTVASKPKWIVFRSHSAQSLE